MRLLLFAFCLAVCCLRADDADGFDSSALDPIVIVEGSLGATPIFGAGIIFSRDKGMLYIVTANHVVRSGGAAVTTLTVRLRSAPAKKLRAKLLERFSPALDLAVLSVDNLDAKGINLCSLSLDRLAPPDSAERGDSVFPVGDANGVAWAIPVRADDISDVLDDRIVFESSLIARGHSGGGLLNESGQLVGMIQADEPPYGRALSFDKILQVLESWKFSIDLDRLNEDGNPSIFSAVADGDTDKVTRLLARRCSDPNVSGEGGFSLLRYALGNLKMVQLLVAAGADVKAVRELVANAADVNVVRFLLSHGAKCDNAPNSAARAGRPDILKVLLSGCVPLQAEDLNQALSEAMDRSPGPGIETMVQALIQAGANVNAFDNGITPLMVAVSRRHLGCAKLLIAAGAKVGARNKDSPSTALERVGELDDLDDHEQDHPMALLLASSSDISDSDGRAKLLRRAAKEGWTDVVHSLIDHGLDVKEKAGEPALLAAVVERQAEVLIVLLRAGANPNMDTGAGKTLLDYVLRDWNSVTNPKLRREFVKLLVERGATVHEEPGPYSHRLYAPLFHWEPPDLEVAELLAANGADLNGIVDDDPAGTYLHYARSKHIQEVVDFLVKHGAKDLDRANYLWSSKAPR